MIQIKDDWRAYDGKTIRTNGTSDLERGEQLEWAGTATGQELGASESKDGSRSDDCIRRGQLAGGDTYPTASIIPEHTTFRLLPCLYFHPSLIPGPPSPFSVCDATIIYFVFVSSAGLILLLQKLQLSLRSLILSALKFIFPLLHSFSPPSPMDSSSPRHFPPSTLADVPIEYIIEQLRNLAPYYWEKPETADCTISPSLSQRPL